MDRSLYLKASAKSKKNKRRQEIVGIGLIALGMLAFYAVMFPAGEWGRHIKGGLAWAFGGARILFPIWMAYVGLRLALAKSWTHLALRMALWAGFFLSLCSLFTLFGQAAFKSNYGGVLGLTGSEFFARLLGVPGAWIVFLGAFGLILCGLFKVTPVHVAHTVYSRLKADLEEWQRARVRPEYKKPPVVKPRPLAAPAAALDPVTPQITKQTAFAADAKNGEAVKEKAVPEFAKPPAIKKPKPQPEPEGQVSLPFDAPPPPPNMDAYELPPLSLLADPKPQTQEQSEKDLINKARQLEHTLATFGVTARVTDIHPGPVITRYDLEPAPGVKISSIVTLSDDIALAMKAQRVRVLAPIPGKGAVGIEIPNNESITVTLKEILMGPAFQNAKSPLTFAIGKTTSGEPTVGDLASMPHLLIAGATGAGKSVAVHALITSILMRAKPNEVKFMLIDPKRLELPFYDGMPHIYDPRTAPENAQVITNPKESAKALTRLVKVMEYRYEQFAKANVRNIESFNQKRTAENLPPEFYIVVIVDELADLMLIAGKEVEDSIQRLAQMARAVGIHLVLATQRPSVDVITGVIKANLPARIALRVASQIDSRVILDVNGAESLVGKGDMLFLPVAAPAPIRIQGAFLSDKEVNSVVAFCKKQAKPFYDDIFAKIAASQAANEDAETKQEIDEALRLIMERKRVSQDLLKAHFGSSARATNVLSLLEVHDFIHKPEGTNKWEINFDKIADYMRIPPPQASAD